jgi:hypothetical protein
VSEDRRVHGRHHVSWKLEGKVFNGLESARVASGPATQTFQGEVTDIGRGGLCLLTADPPETSESVLCVIRGPQTPAGIPTLVQVRWIRKDAAAGTHRVGLQFLV